MNRKLEEKGVEVLLYQRYVDDINMIYRVPMEDGDNSTEEELDAKWMKVVRDIGNQIHHSIKLEIDYPSRHEDGRMPILDLKVWLSNVDGRSIVLHEFYYKEVATKAVTHSRSGMPHSVKRTTLTQELLRIMIRCSPELKWDDVIPHLDNCMLRMQYSGYNQHFRTTTLNSALKAYDEIKRKDREGIQPMYRNKNWRKESREKDKRNKKTQWFRKGGYRSVVFIPCTPGSVLKRKYDEIIRKSKIPIKVVERSGTTIKSKVQKSNPFASKHCTDVENCMVCRTGGTNCRKEGVNYRITCDKCGAYYVGESGRNAYTRGMEHEKEYKKKTEQSVMWRHACSHHSDDDTPPTFTMRVIAVNKGDPTKRQVTEGVQIDNAMGDDLINNKTEWMAGRGIVGASITRM